MEKTKKFGIREILCLLLVLGSMAMLFFPWISIKPDVDGREKSISKILKEEDIDLNDEIKDLCEDFDVEIESDARKNITKLLKQEEHSLIDTAILITYLNDFASAANVTNKDDDADSESELDIESVGKYFQIAMIAVWAIVGVVALMGLLSILFIVKNKKGGVLTYAIIEVLLLAAAVAAVLLINGKLEDIFTSMGLDEVVDYIGDEDVSKFVSIGIAPVVSAAAAFLAYVVMLIIDPAKRAAKKAEKAKKAPPTGKVPPMGKAPVMGKAPAGRCTRCGAEIKPGASFCTSCGMRFDVTEEKKPERQTCKVCHRTWEKQSAFCPYCGAKTDIGAPKDVLTPENVDDVVIPPAPRETPHVAPSYTAESARPAAKLEFKNCPNCGNRLMKSALVCGCGYRFVSNAHSSPASNVYIPTDDDL